MTSQKFLQARPCVLLYSCILLCILVYSSVIYFKYNTLYNDIIIWCPTRHNEVTKWRHRIFYEALQIQIFITSSEIFIFWCVFLLVRKFLRVSPLPTSSYCITKVTWSWEGTPLTNVNHIAFLRVWIPLGLTILGMSIFGLAQIGDKEPWEDVEWASQSMIWVRLCKSNIFHHMTTIINFPFEKNNQITDWLRTKTSIIISI